MIYAPCDKSMGDFSPKCGHCWITHTSWHICEMHKVRRLSPLPPCAHQPWDQHPKDRVRCVSKGGACLQLGRWPRHQPPLLVTSALFLVVDDFSQRSLSLLVPSLHWPFRLCRYYLSIPWSCLEMAQLSPQSLLNSQGGESYLHSFMNTGWLSNMDSCIAKSFHPRGQLKA